MGQALACIALPACVCSIFTCKCMQAGLKRHYTLTMTLATTFVQAGVDQHWQILVGRRKRRANASDGPGLVGGFVYRNETEEGGRLAEPSPQAEATGGSRTVLAVPTSQITGAMAASSSAATATPPMLQQRSIPVEAVAVPQVPLPVKQAPAHPHTATHSLASSVPRSRCLTQ